MGCWWTCAYLSSIFIKVHCPVYFQKKCYFQYGCFIDFSLSENENDEQEADSEDDTNKRKKKKPAKKKPTTDATKSSAVKIKRPVVKRIIQPCKQYWYCFLMAWLKFCDEIRD